MEGTGEQVEWELKKMRFTKHYIERAIKVHRQQHRGDKYNVDDIVRIIKRLQANDAKRKNQAERRSKTPNPESSRKRIVPKKRSLTPPTKNKKRVKLEPSSSRSRHRDLSLIELDD